MVMVLATTWALMVGIHEASAQVNQPKRDLEHDAIRNSPILNHPTSVQLTPAEVKTLEAAIAKRNAETGGTGNALVTSRLAEHLKNHETLPFGDLIAAHGLLMTAQTPDAYALMLRLRPIISQESAAAVKDMRTNRDRARD